MSLSPSTRTLSGDDLPEEEEGGTRELLTFSLGSETFGIRVVHVREVLDYKPIARVSNAPATLLGMIDVRDVGVPVVDLRHKLRMPPSEAREPTTDTRIVVLDFSCGHSGHRTLAVIADSVHEVMDIADQAVEPPPRFGETWDSAFMTGLGRRGEDFLTLLDIPRLFESERFEPFARSRTASQIDHATP